MLPVVVFCNLPRMSLIPGHIQPWLTRRQTLAVIIADILCRLSVHRRNCCRFKLAGNVVGWIHGSTRPLHARMFAGHRLRRCHISSHGHLFAVHGSRHGRQLPVCIRVSLHFCFFINLYFRFISNIFIVVFSPKLVISCCSCYLNRIHRNLTNMPLLCLHYVQNKRPSGFLA